VRCFLPKNILNRSADGPHLLEQFPEEDSSEVGQVCQERYAGIQSVA
jgi:hypothetical protein